MLTILISVRYLIGSHPNKSTYDTAQKMEFSIKDFFSKYDQICKKLRIWSFTEEILNEKLRFFVRCHTEHYRLKTSAAQEF